jgi:hypothetical protein
VVVASTLWWIVGYAVGGAVVAVAAALLIAIIALARRIVHQTAEITLALDGAMRNTDPLYDVATLNHTIERITRRLKALRGDEGVQDERGVLRRMAERLGGGS